MVSRSLFASQYLVEIMLTSSVGPGIVSGVAFDYSGSYLAIGGGGEKGHNVQVQVVKDWGQLLVRVGFHMRCMFLRYFYCRCWILPTPNKSLQLLGRMTRFRLSRHLWTEVLRSSAHLQSNVLMRKIVCLKLMFFLNLNLLITKLLNCRCERKFLRQHSITHHIQRDENYCGLNSSSL